MQKIARLGVLVGLAALSSMSAAGQASAGLGAESGQAAPQRSSGFPFALVQQIQYYTPPPPYAYRKYYAYKNNTGAGKSRSAAPKRSRHHHR